MLNQFGELFSAGLLALEAALSILSDRRGGGLSGQLLGGMGRLKIRLCCRIRMLAGNDKIARLLANDLESGLPEIFSLGRQRLSLTSRTGQPRGSRLLGTGLSDLDSQVGQGGDEGDDDEDGDEDGGNAHDSLLRNLFSLRQKGQPSALLFGLTLSEKLVLI